jgi:hypothetical protein
MYKNFILFPTLLVFLFSCSSIEQKITAQAIGNHLKPKEITVISSLQGQKSLQSIDSNGFVALKKFWEAQKPSYCGVCSAVIVANTLNNKKDLNQVSFFTPPVINVIKPQTVSKMGMTLRELQESLTLREPALRTQKFYSHTSGLDLFKNQLKKWNFKKEMIIVNFSRQSIAGTGMYSGHFSIVAGYDQKSRQVLILEVNGTKESFWISDRDLYTAMLAIDPVSSIPRGWAIVSKLEK